MISKPKGKCVNNNDVKRICATKNCKNYAFICSIEGCKCQQLHQDCLLQPPYQKLFNQIMKKDASGSHCFEQVLEFCNYAIKQFQICKDSVIKMMQQGGTLMGKEEKNLIEFFGNSLKDMTGDSVSRSIANLQTNPLLETKFIQNKIKTETQKYQAILKEILTGIPKLFEENKVEKVEQKKKIEKKTEQTIPKVKKLEQLPLVAGLQINQKFELRFSKTLKSDKLELFEDSKKVIRNQDNNELIVHYAMIQPSIDKLIFYQNPTIILKILQSSIVYVGISSFQDMQKSQFKFFHQDPKQGHFVNNSGTVFSSRKEDHLGKAFNIKGFKNDDVIEMTYFPDKSIYNIKNVTRSEGISLSIPREDKELYFTVGLIKQAKTIPAVQLLGTLKK